MTFCLYTRATYTTLNKPSVSDKIENEFTKIKSKPKPVLPVHVDGTTEHGSTKPFVTLALIFTAAVFVLGSVYLSFPALDE